MKIAQIANNWSEFNPKIAIGIAAVVRDVTVGLVKKGHEVTVIAPEGSVFPGINLQCVGKSLKALGIHLFHADSPVMQTEYVKEVVSQLHGFDMIHSHTEHVLLPFIKDIPISGVVSTIHGAGFLSREQAIFEKYPDNTFVALSEGAKRALPYIHFSSVVYNGISLSESRYTNKPQEPSYLAWMGRISENKGVLDAIEAGKKTGDVVLLVGFEEKGQEAYLQKVKDQEDGAMVRLLDKMIRKEKNAFLGNAKAFLFPIHWEEPFGLVMVEAMACGTPVIANNRGSVPEIVRDGVTGFIIDPDDIERPGKGSWIIKKQGIDGLVEAIGRIGEIDRAACHKHVEEHFSIEKMVEGYEKVYQKVIENHSFKS
jgi:glycosyltransferase involved in cell wall biosynthesis